MTLTGLAEEYLVRCRPAKELVHIRDAGHFCTFTQPDRFLAALLRYVRPLAATYCA